MNIFGQSTKVTDTEVDYDNSIQDANIALNALDIDNLQLEDVAQNNTDVSLQSQINSNNSDITTLQSTYTDLQNTDVSLQNQITSNSNDITTLQTKTQNISSLAPNDTSIDGVLNMTSGNLLLYGNKAVSFATPTNNDDYTNKLYVDQQVSAFQNQIISNDNDITNLQNTDISLQSQINQISGDINTGLDLKQDKSSQNDLDMNGYNINNALLITSAGLNTGPLSTATIQPGNLSGTNDIGLNLNRYRNLYLAGSANIGTSLILAGTGNIGTEITNLQNTDVSLQNQITSNDSDILNLQNTDISLQSQIDNLSSGTTSDLALKMDKSATSNLTMNNFSITGANNIQTTTVNSFNISGSGYVQGAEVRTTGGDLIVNTGDVRPFTTNQSDVGTPALKFQNGYFNDTVNAGTVLLPTGDVGSKLTDLETKTQNIELTTTAGTTDITGVVNVSDKIITTRVESIGGGGIEPLITDNFSASPLKYNATLIGFGGSQAWTPIHDVGNSWIKLTEDAISTTQGYLVYTQPSILTAIGGSTEWYSKVTGFFQDNGNDGNGQCFFTYQHQTPPSSNVILGIGYSLLYFPALGALYIFYENQNVQYIPGQFPVAAQNTDITVEWRILKSGNNRTFTCYVNGVANPNPYTDTTTRTFDTNFVGVGAYTAGSTTFAADYFIRDVEIDTIPSSGGGGGGSAFIDMDASDINANASNINLTTQNVVLGDLSDPLARTKTVTLLPNNTLGADVGTNDFEFTAGFFNTAECAFIRKRPYATSITANDPLTTRELVPEAHNTRDIGTNAIRYKDTYINTLYSNFVKSDNIWKSYVNYWWNINNTLNPLTRISLYPLNSYTFVTGLESAIPTQVGQLFDIRYEQHTSFYIDPVPVPVYVPSPTIRYDNGVEKAFKVDIRVELTPTVLNKVVQLEFLSTINDTGDYSTLNPSLVIEQSRFKVDCVDTHNYHSFSWSFIVNMNTNDRMFFRVANLNESGNDIDVKRFNVIVSQV